MASDQDQFDIDALRIDPTDPAFVPRGATKTRKKKWERKIHPLSVVMVGSPQSNQPRLDIAGGAVPSL